MQHVLDLPATDEQALAIDTWLEGREKQRTTWIHEHGVAGKSMAATVVQRLLDAHANDAGRQRGPADHPRGRVRRLLGLGWRAAGVKLSDRAR